MTSVDYKLNIEKLPIEVSVSFSQQNPTEKDAFCKLFILNQWQKNEEESSLSFRLRTNLLFISLRLLFSVFFIIYIFYSIYSFFFFTFII